MSKFFSHDSAKVSSSSFLIYCLLLLFVSSNLLQAVLAESETHNATKIGDSYFNVINKHGIMRWPTTSMPLQVYIKSGDTTDGYRPVLTTLLQQAFTDWSEGSQQRIRFILTNDPTKAQIICGWTSDKNDMTRLTEGGHALVIPDGHNIRSVEIIILTKTANNENLSDQFFKRVALHEIGHTLGITDHSPDPADMMYGAPLTTSLSCTLTARDKNTLITLYSLDQATVNRSVVNIASMLPDRDNQSNLARIIRLNAEAAKAMQSKNLALAVSKLEEAHKIDPNNDLVNTNLGSAYGNCAVVACLLKDNQRARLYFDKAIPLLAKGQSKDNYLSVLKCYESFLRSNGHVAEADVVEKKIQTISPH